MARDVPIALVTALNGKVTNPVFLIDIATTPVIHLASTFKNLPTVFGDYIGGVLSHLESFGEDNQLQNQNMRFAITGNDAQWLSDALQGNLIGINCDLYFSVLEAGNLAGNSRVWLFSGEIDSCEISDEEENSRIVYTVENFVHQLSRSPGARHTDGFQRTLDPLDQSHSMVGKLAMKDLGVRN